MQQNDYTAMARVAFDVLNWGRRLGLKKDEQINQLAKALEAECNGEPYPDTEQDKTA